MENIKLLERMFNISNKVRDIIYDAEGEDGVRLGRRQLFALSVLGDTDKINMTTLASKISVSNQQLTKIVENLVSRDLVSRFYDTNNRRVILIGLTDKGKEYLKSLSQCIKKTIKGYEEKHSSKEITEISSCIQNIESFLEEILENK